MFFLAYLKNFKKSIDRLLKFIAFFIISFYKIIITGFFGGGGGCRFYPTCGDYALQAYEKHSFFKATRKTLRRLLSCHPFGSVGQPLWEQEENLLDEEEKKKTPSEDRLL